MLGAVRRWVQGSRIYNYNQVERDRWMARMAAGVPAGNSVLDLGAGSAPYRPLFAHCAYRTQDFAQLAPDQLLGRTGYAQIDLVSDATAIPLPDSSVDVVVCTEVLEHVPEPIAVVREISRITKPGGLLLMTAPLGSGLHQEPYHFYGGYTPYWYQRFLAAYGYDDIDCAPNGGFFRLYGQETVRLARMLYPLRHRWWIAPLLVPAWLAACASAVAMPPLCAAADGLDPRPQFTAGYHVRARRRLLPSPSAA